MEKEMEQQRHQEVVEDLVNDLLCNCSAFLPRRRRQRPLHLRSPSSATSCIPLDSPLVQDPCGPPAVTPLALPTERTCSGAASAKSTKRGIAASTGPSATTKPKRDSLAAKHSRRKLVPAYTRGRDLPELTSRAHSGGKVLPAKADTSKDASPTFSRSHTAMALSRPAQPARRQLTAAPTRALSHRDLTVAPNTSPSLHSAPSRHDAAPTGRNVASSVHLKALAHAVIASTSTRTPSASANLAMLSWEHQERLEIKARRAQAAALRDHSEPNVDPASGEDGSCG
ncbi:hypothetical protein T484DRAFT_1783247 [Baffinella frigidus]|nr:hypothetical protein T484DRAFT_1783247 [Cryptophyta sp. CCMP2293]